MLHIGSRRILPGIDPGPAQHRGHDRHTGEDHSCEGSVDLRQIEVVPQNSQPAKQSLTDHAKKNPDRGKPHRATGFVLMGQYHEGDRPHPDQHARQPVAVLHELVPVTGKVTQPRVGHHELTIRGRPVSKRHPGLHRCRQRSEHKRHDRHAHSRGGESVKPGSVTNVGHESSSEGSGQRG